MPSCLVNHCLNKSGKKASSENIMIHKFPSDRERVKLWLLQTGQIFQNVESMADKICHGSKQNKYALCSLHFEKDCYLVTSTGRVLKKDALPTLFPRVPEGESVIAESLKKDRKRNRKRPLELTRTKANAVPSTSLEEPGVQECVLDKQMHSVGTQTDYTLLNSELVFVRDELLPTAMGSAISSTDMYSANPMASTPMSSKSRQILYSITEFTSPLKKKAHIETEDLESHAFSMEGIGPLSPIDCDAEKQPECPTAESSFSAITLNHKETSFVPEKPSMDSSELFDYLTLFPENPPPTVTFSSEREIVNDRKLIIFESCLDNVLMKVHCQFDPNCKNRVKTIKKTFQGSFFRVTGQCFGGHKFHILESQPKIKNYASGNLLLAASILFSGLNFQKVAELFEIFGLVGISQTSYYRYQTKFLFPVIDYAWKENQKINQDKISKKGLCVAGDGQCDSPGHSAKYCVYTILDTITGKILDFEVVQRSQCNSSVAMEKFGFEICINRLIEKGFKIRIFASDRHVGIRKKLKEDYETINHQFDIWHYAKSLKKKITSASKLRLCKELVPWVDKIILHFWWCVQNCERNPNLLQEKWSSVLNHVVNIHEWEGNLYSKCGHAPLNPEDHDLFWLKQGFPPYKNLERIVKNEQLIKELPNLVHNCHTGRLENFHSLALKYRSKRIHFGIDSMEARTKLAALTHNNNVGRPQAVVQFEKKTSQKIGTKRTTLVIPKGKSRWFIRDVYEKVSVDYLEDLSINVLQLARGELNTDWTSRAPTLPPNLANKERPNKEEIQRHRLIRFRCSSEPFLANLS
ncbi:uncharacterized protein [Engystomops pustulosus]|uniref:uncharacterized protein n=1 Tax=Engystomops pustulosus TaxID=76066 RepID=UPI003AFA03E0